MIARVASLLATLALLACSTVGVRHVEEPSYTVATKLGLVEVRQYGPRVAAETVVDGDELAARSAGFRHIASYIFGANHAGLKIGMTAPVSQTADAAGRWRIRFYMPASYTLATLPQPDDAQVQLVSVPPETLAVLRFTGSSDPQAVAARTGELVSALEGSAWRPAGAPMASYYDPPWTLPPLPRNEVAIPVSPN
jgi:SOUL heme-binding protein